MVSACRTFIAILFSVYEEKIQIILYYIHAYLKSCNTYKRVILNTLCIDFVNRLTYQPLLAYLLIVTKLLLVITC